MTKNTTDPKIIVALDFSSTEQVFAFTDRVDPGLCRLKVGKELFTHAGPDLVRSLVEKGFDIFLDLKFHDIPNTVAKACTAAAELGVWMMNIHASGGRPMMEAAYEALTKRKGRRPLLIGVTVLTSLDRNDLNEMGILSSPAEQVLRLARLAQVSGLDGVVCSPQEVNVLRGELGKKFLLVTPGIRPAGSDRGDQKRVMTPVDAIQAGSNYLVIGRPITQADDPVMVLNTINQEISALQK
jgi:orotidine-5'-phosphate decarboxylase